MNNLTEKAAYSVNEFLISFGIGRTKFYQEVEAGRLRILKCGKRTLIRRSDAENWLNSLEEAAKC